MNKKYAKFMRYGKTVKSQWTDTIFKLIEDMNEDKETVRGVSLDVLNRYDLLNAWIRNYKNDKSFREKFTMDIKKCENERDSYEQELLISDVKPADKIRFIYPDYTSKFEADDLSNILVDGKARKVIYVDAYHFAFVDTGRVFHICEYAELCDKNKIKVKPQENNSNLFACMMI